MKVGDSKRTGSGPAIDPAGRRGAVSGPAAAARPAPASPVAPAGAAAQPAAVASVMGLSEAEFTPKVRAAIMALMAEVDKLRQELRQSQQRIAYLEQLADTDSLTPIANRRAFVRELSRMMSFAERYQTPSSVIYFDVNGLKAVNDTLGHAAGDAVLAEVADVLKKNVRDSDFVGRLGGDEFGVILAHADERAATEKASSLAQLIAERPLAYQGRQLAMSVSWGVHAFFGGGDADGALDAADRAMYARKREGRNPA